MRSGLTRRAAIASLAALAACLDSPGDGSKDDDAGPSQLLVNPSFEDGATGWTFDGSVELETAEMLGLPPSDGAQVARLGYGDNQTDRLFQEVRVPASGHELVLSGVRCYITQEGSGMIYDRLTITIEPVDGGAAETIREDSNQDATLDGCQWLPFEASSADDHAGQLIRLVIEAMTDDGVLTSFAFDDLALTASP